jgi:hypothetical protein
MTPQARIEDLEEQVAYLRSELGLAEDLTKLEAIRTRLGLTPTVGKMLLALRASNGRVLSNGFLSDNFTTGKDEAGKLVHIHIHRLRSKIGPDALKTSWGQGYYLTPEGIEIVDQATQPLAPNVHAVKRFCKHGHLLSGANVLINKSKTGSKRTCRTCHRERQRAHRSKNQSAALTN